MANCYIDFICEQQDIKRHDSNVVAEGANVLYARFYLCPKWDGLALYARFKHMAAVYDVPITDNCALVPWEVVKYTGFEVSIFGEGSDGSRLTSESVVVPVARSLEDEGAAPLPNTPAMMDLFIAKAAAAEAAAVAAEESVKVVPAHAEAAAASAKAAQQSAAAAEAAKQEIHDSTEVWELTMADGSTVRKVVCVQ